MPAIPQPRTEPTARQRILQAAFRLIGTQGIAALTNRRIAAAASVSLGSLTYHFPNQEDLLRECLEQYIQEEVGRIEGAAEALRERRLGMAELGAEIQRLAAAAAERPEQIAELEMHLQAARDPALQATSRLCFAAYEGFAAAALEALRIPEPRRHAPHVVALMLGIGVKQLGTGERNAAGLGDALQTVAQGALARAGSPPTSAVPDDSPSDGEDADE